MKETGKWYGRIALFSIIINMVIEAMGRKSPYFMFRYIIENPLVFLLNTMMIGFPFLLVFLTRKKWFAFVLVSALWLLAGTVNGYLLTIRTTPLTAADFRLVKYGLQMITSYMTWTEILLSAAGCILILAVCLLVWNKAPVSPQPVSYLKGGILLTASLGMVLSAAAVSIHTGLISDQFGNIGQAYKDYGFAYCFSNSLFNTGISRPNPYNKDTVSVIEAALVPENSYELHEHKTPNIIMIQLESFFDPMLYRNYVLKEDPIPFFRYLQRFYSSGFLNVPSVGAGTANTEFECITGMNLDFFGPGEYPYKTVLQKTTCESMAFNMKSLGYTTHAIHNNEATFYDRHKVFSQLGFDTFTPIEYMDDIKRNRMGWCKDELLVEDIIQALDSTKNQDFIYAITVQGHGAYPDYEYFCEQMKEVDDVIKRLIYTLRDRKEPTVVALYGDHLPGFPWEAGDMENHSLYQTPYVIWNNMNLPIQKREVEAYQLTSYLLNMLNIHEGTMIRYHQSYLNQKNPDKDKYLENMKVLEYDMLYGDQEIYNGEMPYKATDLQLGILPIQVDIITYQEPHLLLFGENFTPYSKVYVGDKAMETMYVWPQLLIVKDFPEKKMKREEITVWQVGKDHVPLGEAVRYQKE